MKPEDRVFSLILSCSSLRGLLPLYFRILYLNIGKRIRSNTLSSVIAEAFEKCGCCEKNYFSIPQCTVNEWHMEYLYPLTTKDIFDEVIDLNNFLSNVRTFRITVAALLT
jgi:hypothetical protein